MYRLPLLGFRAFRATTAADAALPPRAPAELYRLQLALLGARFTSRESRESRGGGGSPELHLRLQ